MRANYTRCAGCANSEGSMCAAVPQRHIRENEVPSTEYKEREGADYGVIGAARCEDCRHWTDTDSDLTLCRLRTSITHRQHCCDSFERRKQR